MSISNTVVISSTILHELNALIDDMRLMVTNSQSFIMGISGNKRSAQIGISARKKEIKTSLKLEWLNTNSESSERDFNSWLSDEISKAQTVIYGSRH